MNTQTEELSRRDHIGQMITPTLMVPRDSAPPECRIGQTRFLMASDGLYIETRVPFGSLVRRLWTLERGVPLPYGDVSERDDFGFILRSRLLPLISETMLPAAALQAEKEEEWAGLIVWDGAEFVPWAAEFETGRDYAKSLDRGLADLPAGYSIACDIHSHHAMPPFFSPDDNTSDSGRVKIALVLGNYRTEDGVALFDVTGRYCVEGMFFDIPTWQEENK